MDEIVFRSSQKVENLKLHAEVTAVKVKEILVIYVQQGRLIFAQIWNSATVEELKTKFSTGVLNVINIAKNTKIQFMSYVNPREIYLALLNTLGKKWTKRDIFFTFSGLLIGGIVGFAIGFSIRKKDPILRYMQAIHCTNSLGSQSVVVVEDAVAPYNCGEYEVLVDVKAASVQNIDVAICSGYGSTLRKILQSIHKSLDTDLPVILGRDCAGIITDIGSKVTRLEVGDEVWLTVPFWSRGTLCQTILVDENRVARKPKNIGFEGAASLPYAGSLALSVLEETRINSSNGFKKKILIQGGCTSVGCVLIQLLRHWKASITATCYKRAVPVVKALGATDIIIQEEPKLLNSDNTFFAGIEQKTLDASLLKDLEVKGELFDIIIKTGTECNLKVEQLSKFLKSDGTVLSTLPPLLPSDSYGLFRRSTFFLYVRLKYAVQNLFGLPFTDYDEAHLCYVVLDRLAECVEDGFLQTVVDKIYQPQDIEIAISHIQSPLSIGSSVITFR